ncbi:MULTISPECIES: HalOD1 output domain-containing protein [Halobacterium]|uniref:Vng6372h n=2 Tax=Halobacterium salinarum NRC-34001 TaxID=2886895 RepID=Q9HHI9_HALSA|nr:HalOD1 output domain-containing protein [Halobacterium salinarum]AAG20991.1 Vng6372h [Halobacterium salinarum NRC-1]MDL0122134.1 hypothetical protein [Halobacterium salinarum]MDL0145899.1 hypothetical protein [Halobacterium salinarum]CAP15224.1 uncharacterized protein OE_6052R [Halobacterium salinarum R1]DAC79958.1 TPA_inf: uncharacterized protein VNG_6372H [Halobacterium salinarum NRC-1]
MRHSPSDSSDRSNDLLIKIIETLEACGIEEDTYQLHDYVDLDALEQLLASPNDDISVQFTVEGVQLDVSPKSVDVLGEDRSSTTED